MRSNPTPLALATLAGVILCWIFFAGIFLLRKRPPKAPGCETRQARNSGDRIADGWILSGLFPAVRTGRFFLRFRGSPGVVGILFSSLYRRARGGLGMVRQRRVRTLGRQWAVQARLVEDHKLITEGPYAYIRNPIYTGHVGDADRHRAWRREHWIALVAADRRLHDWIGDPSEGRGGFADGRVRSGVRGLCPHGVPAVVPGIF